MSNEPGDHGGSLIGTREASERLGCSQDTVIRLARTGAIPALLVGKRYKFKTEAIEQYLEAARVAQADRE